MNTHNTPPTLSLIRELNNRGISRMSVAMRHSARHYDEDVTMEPFMCLTGKGRSMAMAMGEGLPENATLQFFSSYIGRCIETAYLIDKGFVGKAGGVTVDNRVAMDMSPFYVKNMKKTVEMLLDVGTPAFMRHWMDGAIDDSLLMHAGKSAERMLKFMAGSVAEAERNTLLISVTHDWNIYLLKEYALDLHHETYGPIEFLEGVVVFEDGGKFYAMNHQKGPVPLKCP